MRVYVVGGFLGAGKTTAIRALARLLRAQGERVAIVTNDQGEALVDTMLCRHDGLEVTEIPGGCFCCRYADLEQALLEAEWTGATVALAEAVGSCTDLVATVLSPLIARRGARLDIAPLSVAVDAARLAELDRGGFSDDIRYLYDKQIEEADVVVVTKADLDPPDVTARIQSLRPGAAVVRLSATTGQGLTDWLAAAPLELARPLDIDYDRYASAEAELGWANGRVRLRAAPALSASALFIRFLDGLADLPITHVKVTAIEPAGGAASLVRRGGRATIEAGGLPAEVGELALLVNARAALSPGELESSLKRAMARATEGCAHEWEALSCFSPMRPVPTHRHVTRCSGPGDPCCPSGEVEPWRGS